jgi:hypothetical protein
MEIKISQAYKALAQLDLAAKKKSLKASSLKEEIKTSRDELINDLSSFDKEVTSLLEFVESGEYERTLESFINIRAKAMDVSTIFSNLVEQMDTFIQNTDLYGDLEEYD